MDVPLTTVERVRESFPMFRQRRLQVGRRQCQGEGSTRSIMTIGVAGSPVIGVAALS